jgi:outer membrane lipoprotein-sorting protein
MKKPIISSGRISFQPPNKFRREVKGNSPSLTMSDGRQLWIYYPNFKSAERYPLGKGSPLDSTVAAINSALSLENIENTFQINGTKSYNAAGVVTAHGFDEARVSKAQRRETKSPHRMRLKRAVIYDQHAPRSACSLAVLSRQEKRKAAPSGRNCS